MLVELDLVAKLFHCRIVKFKGSRYDSATRTWDYPTFCEDNCAGFDDFQDIKNPENENLDSLYLIPDYMSYGDYSNGRAVQESNYKAFLANHYDTDNELAIVKLTGYFYSNGLAIKLTELSEPMFDDLASLENYPILDDSTLYEVELEGQQEAWDCWAKSDFVKGLAAKFNLEFDVVEDDEVLKLFLELCERSNTYWFEDGCDQYIDLDRIIESAKLEDVENWPII